MRTVSQQYRSHLVRSEQGQAMVEFALTITVTFVLVFGLIELSRAVYTSSVIQWAAQNGARAAIIQRSQGSNLNTIEAAVNDAVRERLIGLDPDEVVVSPSRWSGSSGNVVQVEVMYPFRFIAPIVSQITGETIEMRSRASMIAY